MYVVQEGIVLMDLSLPPIALLARSEIYPVEYQYLTVSCVPKATGVPKIHPIPLYAGQQSIVPMDPSPPSTALLARTEIYPVEFR